MRTSLLSRFCSPARILPVPHGVLAAAILALVGVVPALAQTNFVWTNSAPAQPHNWSQSGWTNNLGSASGPSAGGSNNYAVSFSLTGITTATNDLAGAFQLSRMSVAVGNFSFTNYGNDLVFVTNSAGVTPVLSASFGSTGNRFVTFSNNMVISNSVTVDYAGSGGSFITISLLGNLSGPGGLTKSSPGVLTLGGSNSYSGGTLINGGTNNLNHAWALGTGALVLSNGVTLNNTSAASVSLATVNTQVWYGGVNFLGTQSLNMNTGAVTLAGGAPTLNIVAGSLTVGALLDGGNGYGLTKLGAGTLGLAGSNVLGGAVVVNGGTLLLTNLLGSLANISSLSLANGSTNLLDNRGAANANRLADSAPIALNGANLQLLGNGSALTETVGAITLGLGASSLLGTNGAVLSSTSLSRGSGGSTLNVIGTGGVVFASAPGASNAIQPWLIFQGTNFGVHDGNGTAIRTFTNYSTTFAAGSDTLWATTTSTGGVSVSTLVIAANVGVTAGQVLTNTGGGLLFRTSSTFGITNGSLLFTAPETVIYNDASDSIYTPMSAASVTKSGAGTLSVSAVGGANVSTGTVRIVQGSLSQSGAMVITNAGGTGTLDIAPAGLGSYGLLSGATLYVDHLYYTNNPGVFGITFAAGSTLNIGGDSSIILTNTSAQISLGSTYNQTGGAMVMRSGPSRFIAVGSGVVMRVTGNGTVFDGDRIALGYAPSSGDNTLLVDNGAKVIASIGLLVGSNASVFGGANTIGGRGSVVVSNGTIQANQISVGTNGQGTISVVGGTLLFVTNTPTIDLKTAGTFTMANGTVAFSGVTNAAVSGQITNITYSGANTLRLISATNAALAYAISNGAAFSTLELVNNGATWQGSTLLIGSGGLLRTSNSMATLAAVLTNSGTVSVINGQLTYLSNVVLSGGTFLTQNGTNVFTRGLGLAAGAALSFTNGSSQVSGTITNSGTISAVNSYVTFAGPVVNSGLYVSDPSTNIFTSNLTVTASGALQGSNGDLFVFNQDFLNQSTNAGQFNLAHAAVLFTNSATHLLSVSNSGSLNIGQGFASFAEVATNFAIGQLSIAAANRVTLAGNKDSLTNALYVGWLDIQGLTLGGTNSYLAVSNTLVTALSLPNINLYYDVYDTRNDWLTRWLPASAGAGYDLWGGGLLLPIPEPSVLGSAAAGLALLALLRRRPHV